jgi:2-polyprenyl-6-hydroxyphenyl methylase/3-demethylubiquinone-9 3-methyltransferase
MQRNNLAIYDAWAAEWWQENAKVYALNYLNPARFAYFDRHISNWKGLKVLDVGCGGGFTCEFLAKRGALVTGVDQSAACIAAAHAHAHTHHLPISYHTALAEALPIAAQTIDVVVCVDVLEHVADLAQTLTEIHRVLKPGGVFCFDTINRTFKAKLVMIWLLETVLNEIPQGVHDWHKFVQPEELAVALRSLNFQAIETQGFDLFGSTLLDYYTNYSHYRKTKRFNITLNQNTSIMYIGKAIKAIE